MPIYEYRCKSCAGEFEYQQSMNDDAKTVCESCQGDLERLISRSAFHLKGGGWYKDLYSSTNAKSGGSSASSSTADSGTSSAPESCATCPNAAGGAKSS